MINGYKTIARFTLAHEAHLARTKLESEGIPCQLLNEYTVTMDWFYANAVGGIQLIVPQLFCDRALTILSADHTDELSNLPEHYSITSIWQDEEPDFSDEQDMLPVSCPFCNSSDTELTHRTTKKSWISFFTLGFIPRPVQNSYLCHICLNRWNETEAFF